MTEEGLRQLQVSGVRYGLERVTLESVCAAVDVPRSSSHSAWSFEETFTPQAMFQRCVVEAWMAGHENVRFATAAQTALGDLYERRQDAVTASDVIRCGIQSAIVAALSPFADPDARDSGFLSTDMALKHALASQPPAERDPDVQRWVREAEIINRKSRIEDSYRPLAQLLGFVPRPEFGDEAFEHFALGVAALVEGITLRHLLLPELNVAYRTISPSIAGEEPATLAGVCAEALMNAFFEPIPPPET